MRRVLLVERISDDKGERSESIESQDEKLRRRASAEGVTIVGTAVDLSVSGGVDPFARKALGPWLTDENLRKWDELWISTADRLSRDQRHFLSFVMWAQDHSKKILVMDDPEFNKQMQDDDGLGLFILHTKALGPAAELRRIKARNKDSHERRRFTTRWPGGIPPFGYRPVKRYEEGRTATYLEQDPDMVEALQWMRERMVEGQSFTGLAGELNDKGVLTARDRARVRKGKPVKARGGEEGVPERWGMASVKSLLTDESLLGYKKHGKEVLYDSLGQPIKLAEPVFTDDEWQSLQAAIEKRKATKTPRVNKTSPLYGVMFCSRCGAKARHKVHSVRDVQYRYYVCGGWPTKCTGISTRADEVEEWLELEFLIRNKYEKVTEKVWVPGTDHTKELGDIKKRIARLRDNYEAGAYDDDTKAYKERLHALRARRDELEAEPTTEGHWAEKDTGQTYGELWPKLDADGQRKQLIRSGFRVEVGQKTFNVTGPAAETWPERRARLIRQGQIPAGE
ncbi:recombinase family protein [Streptomyces sp. NPDC056190]|uniref:recombinase family protein n=1 Tax=Streptomyces sp. NPDC056190 TaxID=3345741 RepID=UPI0035E309E6